MKATILIIDDDVQIGDMEQALLEQNGYQVMRAYSGTEALLLLERAEADPGAAAKACKPDLVLLDLMLPGMSGEEVLQKIQGIPVIVISAKVAVEDKVSLLTGGAADYITKPFDNQELLARIQVQLRQAGAKADAEATAGTQGSGHMLNHGDISLDTLSHQVTVGGQPVSLTKTEYAILKLLMGSPKQVFSKSAILDRIAEDTPDCTEGSLKIHVSHLRSKLRQAGGTEADYIESVWGIGFKMGPKS